MLAAVALPPGAAAADDDGFSIGARPAWFLLGGVTAGGTLGIDDRGGFVGGEMSVVRMRGNLFLGVYADGYYDFAIDGTYVTVGPELGVIRRSRTRPIGFGIDGGAAVRFGDGRDLGATGRVYIDILGMFAIYGRYVHFPGADTGDRVIQVGALLKFPLIAPFGSATH